MQKKVEFLEGILSVFLVLVGRRVLHRVLPLPSILIDMLFVGGLVCLMCVINGVVKSQSAKTQRSHTSVEKSTNTSQDMIPTRVAYITLLVFLVVAVLFVLVFLSLPS